MKLGNVLSTVVVCSSIAIVVSLLSLVFSFALGNGFFGSFVTITLVWTWLMGTGVLMSMEQRSKK